MASFPVYPLRLPRSEGFLIINTCLMIEIRMAETACSDRPARNVFMIVSRWLSRIPTARFAALAPAPCRKQQVRDEPACMQLPNTGTKHLQRKTLAIHRGEGGDNDNVRRGQKAERSHDPVTTSEEFACAGRNPSGCEACEREARNDGRDGSQVGVPLEVEIELLLADLNRSLLQGGHERALVRLQHLERWDASERRESV